MKKKILIPLISLFVVGAGIVTTVIVIKSLQSGNDDGIDQINPDDSTPSNKTDDSIPNGGDTNDQVGDTVQVTYLDSNGEELYSKKILKGSNSKYENQQPNNKIINSDFINQFIGWDKSEENIMVDTIFNAEYVKTPNVSMGLEYELSSSKDYMIVSGIGEFSGDYLSIPYYYMNYPVKKIKDEAFVNAVNIKRVYIPDCISDIGNNIFEGSYNIVDMDLPYLGSKVLSSESKEASLGYLFSDTYFTNSTNVNFYSTSGSKFSYYLPANLRNIRIRNGKIFKTSFGSYQNLSTLFLGKNASLTSSDIFTFQTRLSFYTENNESDYIPPSWMSSDIMVYFDSFYDNLVYKDKTLYLLNDNNASIVSGDKESSSFDIAASINYDNKEYSVNRINSYAFVGSKLESIVIPDTIGKIDLGAFISSTKLKSVKLSKSISLISDLLFRYCSKLEAITIPKNVESLGKYAFANCTELTTIDYEFGGKLEKIGFGCFDNDLKLSLRLPQSFKENIGSYDGVSMKSKCFIINGNNYIYDSNNLCYLSMYTYMNDTSNDYFVLVGSNPAGQSSLTISNKCEVIGAYAITSNSFIEGIIIPNSVTSISSYAIGCGSNFKFFVYNGTKEEWNKIRLSENWCVGNKTYIKCTDGNIEIV